MAASKKNDEYEITHSPDLQRVYTQIDELYTLFRLVSSIFYLSAFVKAPSSRILFFLDLTSTACVQLQLFRNYQESLISTPLLL